ncbi:hypothetical protein GE107_07450 [Cohnella sp. CFH 77786]|uniref:hypothetical protein n=1 Tax=Cohnella sp. CFH 77786 TaxID=2662265 RepID=UPI001C60C509|nr:hypothetical protein [Cohnella sp. CFH 77786]MBW5445892.1 hypothetical protein [Cohnella sp. CFH 77786]
MLKFSKKGRTWLGILTVAALIGVIGFYSTVEADSTAIPGSGDDPVVTKSYVDQKIAEIVQGGGGGTPPVGSGAMAPLEVVKVPTGKTIIVNAGGELIVRTGKAIAFSPDANGLSDMTDGLDIAPGKPIGNNHLILFPRDGRGVKQDPKSKVELIVLVRGGYQLK